jgi:hypothetical protein
LTPNAVDIDAAMLAPAPPRRLDGTFDYTLPQAGRVLGDVHCLETICGTPCKRMAASPSAIAPNVRSRHPSPPIISG